MYCIWKLSTHLCWFMASTQIPPRTFCERLKCSKLAVVCRKTYSPRTKDEFIPCMFCEEENSCCIQLLLVLQGSVLSKNTRPGSTTDAVVYGHLSVQSLFCDSADPPPLLHVRALYPDHLCLYCVDHWWSPIYSQNISPFPVYFICYSLLRAKMVFQFKQ